jgi:hypothetical protein
MEPLVEIPLLVLAVTMLAAGAWAGITHTRVRAWAATAALLWLGTASFAVCAFVGSSFTLVLLGWSLSSTGFVVALYALGVPRLRATRPTNGASGVETRHVVNSG